MATTRIEQYVDRLRLSPGDLLGLAREVTENAALRSIDNLTEIQTTNLLQLLAFLAEPLEDLSPHFGGYRVPHRRAA
jgi:hypothetical protein